MTGARPQVGGSPAHDSRQDGGTTMQITEIYKSLQGESTYAGLPCVFVRLTGCNLRCSWCDSEYTFQGGHKMDVEAVLDTVSQLSPDGGLVEITGGEPMLQEREVVPLMQRLVRRWVQGASRDQWGASARTRAFRCHQDCRREVPKLRGGRHVFSGEPGEPLSSR